MKKGKLIILSAPSGSGKSTIVKEVIRRGLPLSFSVSATSRPPRPREENGVHYHFLSVEEFKQKIQDNDFLEWEEVYANQFYGTLKSAIEEMRNEGKHVVFDVDVVGGLNIKKFYGDEALSLFVMAPSIEELEKRLMKRGTESSESLKKRLDKAAHEMTFAPKFDVVIENKVLKTAVEKCYQTIFNFIHHD